MQNFALPGLAVSCELLRADIKTYELGARKSLTMRIYWYQKGKHLAIKDWELLSTLIG